MALAPLWRMLVTSCTSSCADGDAEVLTLANNEGRIQLTLRNSTDEAIAKTPGTELASLYGARKTAPAGDPDAQAKARPQPRQAVQIAASQPLARIAPAPEEVVMIRGNQKTVEVVGTRSLSR